MAARHPVQSTAANTTQRADGNYRIDPLTIRILLPRTGPSAASTARGSAVHGQSAAANFASWDGRLTWKLVMDSNLRLCARAKRLSLSQACFGVSTTARPCPSQGYPASSPAPAPVLMAGSWVGRERGAGVAATGGPDRHASAAEFAGETIRRGPRGSSRASAARAAWSVQGTLGVCACRWCTAIW